MNRHNILLAGAFAVLAAVAVAGWVRKAPPANANPANTGWYAQPASNQAVQPQTPVTQSANVTNPAPYNTAQEPQYDSYGRPIPAQANAPVTSPVSVSNPCPTAGGVNYSSALYEPAYANAYAPPPNPGYWNRPVRVMRRDYVETSTADRAVYRVHHPRSKRKSVMIVAGSAAAGAGIGALAGGGKGAGIGALAGGLGGFIYDRLTHNR